MNILSIGNSFSQDAQKWLHQIAESAGEDFYCVNLYIGGCPLARHWNNFVTQEPVEEMWINGVFERKISINEALHLMQWDVITFQQASPYCGDYTTYQPYLSYLYREAKAACPDAGFYIHQTWSYEVTCTLGAYDNFHRSQKIMDERSIDAYAQASAQTGLELIPCGDVIRYLRNTPEFNYPGGGMSLNRDGFHLSWDYGRYAAGLTWFCFLSGKKPETVSFVPVVEEKAADQTLLKKIGQAVSAVLHI